MTAKGDCTASHHYVRPSDVNVLTNVRKYAGQSVTLPDGDKIAPSHQGELPVQGLSQEARTATVLPRLKSSTLLSLGQLCDDGCSILLTKTHLYGTKDKRVILAGTRNHTDGL